MKGKGSFKGRVERERRRGDEKKRRRNGIGEVEKRFV